VQGHGVSHSVLVKAQQKAVRWQKVVIVGQKPGLLGSTYIHQDVSQSI